MNERPNGRLEHGTPLRLLCIEDHKEDAEFERASLNQAGYEVGMNRVLSGAVRRRPTASP